MAIQFVGAISPMPHRSYCSICERTVTGNNNDFSHSPVDADHYFQDDFASQAWARGNRVAEAAHGRLGNLQALGWSRVYRRNWWPGEGGGFGVRALIVSGGNCRLHAYCGLGLLNLFGVW